jgi:hypothetical protein
MIELRSASLSSMMVECQEILWRRHEAGIDVTIDDEQRLDVGYHGVRYPRQSQVELSDVFILLKAVVYDSYCRLCVVKYKSWLFIWCFLHDVKY